MIVDSFIRFHAADENSATEMGRVMTDLRALANAGATVVLQHHKPKAEGTQYRGSSDIKAGVDVAFAVAIQPDARIVAAGYAWRGSGRVFALARYDSGLTPLDLTIALSARVEALVNAGILNPGQGNSLDSKLAQVVQSLNRAKINTACNHLQAFINEVDARINSGVLTAAQGEPLIRGATGIRSLLGCR